MTCRNLRAVKGAGNIDVHYLMKVFGIKLHYINEWADPRVIHQKVNPPHFFECQGDHLIHLLIICDIAANPVSFIGAVFKELCRSKLGLLLAGVCDDDPRSFFRKDLAIPSPIPWAPPMIIIF